MSPTLSAPVVVALSGGGDSMALLALAAGWAADHGRTLVAVTVDHGLNPDSPDWSRRCARAARLFGAEWRECRWAGDKPRTGLTAAARAARHALIAGAAREVGASVILTGHTADDVAEADWMRARPVGEGGSTLGRLRDWSPSPAWPEGRGLMLLRPLLEERREALRLWLRAGGIGWIDDPANDDAQFGRARARQALGGAGPLATDAAGIAADLPPLRALPFGAGFETGRGLPPRVLAAVLVCAAGGAVPPRGDRLAALARRLASGEDFTATLSGSRIEAAGERVMIGREPGEIRRRSIAPLDLTPGVPGVWDGRVEVMTAEPGWRITAAAGRLDRLPEADRAALARLPAWARGAAPVGVREEGIARDRGAPDQTAPGQGAAVLIRDAADAPVLAGAWVKARFLSPRRLNLTLSGFGIAFPGETTHETGLFDRVHGETPITDLFSVATDEPAPQMRAPQDRKPR